MSKDAQKSVALTEEAKRKFEECVAALAACGFGVDGPPEETTFAQIEEFGHEVGRMVARAVDEQLATQHATLFDGVAPCPTCHRKCPVKEPRSPREVQTCDGHVPLREPVCHCSVCHRDFFPSTHRLAD